MEKLELIGKTLMLIKILHTQPDCCLRNEFVYLAPKTLEQLDNAIKACNQLEAERTAA